MKSERKSIDGYLNDKFGYDWTKNRCFDTYYKMIDVNAFKTDSAFEVTDENAFEMESRYKITDKNASQNEPGLRNN